MNTVETFWSRSIPEPNTGCWLWLGKRHKAGYSYGLFNFGGGRVLAHRFAYELVRGPIPAGLTVDHRCKLAACVNPDHLEAVTLIENQRRGGYCFRTARSTSNALKTHCPRGHAYDGIGKRGDGQTFRMCKRCDNVRTLRRYHARRAYLASGLTFAHPEKSL